MMKWERHFNPRPLAGATMIQKIYKMQPPFQSTPPCGGDALPRNFQWDACISIHAPLRGRPAFPRWKRLSMYFNPRPLAGATDEQGNGRARLAISIHAPLRGRRSASWINTRGSGFQSTPPCGGDMLRRSFQVSFSLFQSTPPCGGDNPGTGCD